MHHAIFFLWLICVLEEEPYVRTEDSVVASVKQEINSVFEYF